MDNGESKGIPEKHLLLSLTTLKPLTVWITTNCGKFLKRREYQTTVPACWETCMQVKKQRVSAGHGTTNWFKIGKGVRQGCILSPSYLTSMQSHQAKCRAGLSTIWYPDFQKKYQQPQICRWHRWHHPYGRKQRGTKEPLDKSERGEWKSWLET